MKSKTVILFLVLCCLGGTLFADENLLKQADFNGGVILHIGSGDGARTASLYKSENTLVYGLETSAANVQEATR